MIDGDWNILIYIQLKYDIIWLKMIINGIGLIKYEKIGKGSEVVDTIYEKKKDFRIYAFKRNCLLRWN